MVEAPVGSVGQISHTTTIFVNFASSFIAYLNRINRIIYIFDEKLEPNKFSGRGAAEA
jgi:hypothetical protein